MKISEIMTEEVMSVNEDMPIYEVARIISKNKIHAVPVVDKNSKVLGIITETDFFIKDSSGMLYMPSLIDFVRSGKLDYKKDEERETVKEVLNAKAKDIMSLKCEVVSPDMKLEDFIQLIKEKTFNSYPVADASGYLVGIITVADAIKLF